MSDSREPDSSGVGEGDGVVVADGRTWDSAGDVGLVATVAALAPEEGGDSVGAEVPTPAEEDAEEGVAPGDAGAPVDSGDGGAEVGPPAWAGGSVGAGPSPPPQAVRNTDRRIRVMRKVVSGNIGRRLVESIVWDPLRLDGLGC